ncbi:hypothetical protein F4819DRAFT_443838 [Hypoxylon fuscum]|nr:hypothetical protein F4819DRAFT_443838 [Hypoxylon fuscum]
MEASTTTTYRNILPAEPVKQRTSSRTKPGKDGVTKLIEDINAKVGDPPPKGAPREEDDRYLDNFMGEMHRSNQQQFESWPELQKSQDFVANMGKRRYQPLGNGEENGLPKNCKSTRSVRLRQASTAGTNGGAKSRKRPRKAPQAEADERRQATSIGDPAVEATPQSPDTPCPSNGTRMDISAICNPSPNPAGAPESRDGPRPKKRRTGTANLESNLGSGWEPKVDTNGHRPTRSARGAKKP